MSKDPNPGRAFVVQRRGKRVRELDAGELASVLGGTERTRPNLDREIPRAAKSPSRSGGFWRWLLG